MTVTFDKTDEEYVEVALQQAGLSTDKKLVADVLCKVNAAFLQQLPEEIEYMVNEFESGSTSMTAKCICYCGNEHEIDAGDDGDVI